MDTMDNLKDKWEPVEKIDPKKRKPNEWAKIYSIKLIGEYPNELWSEYEWSFYLPTLKYMPIPDKNGEFEYFSEMDLRSLEIRRDLFMGADIGERHVLTNENKYIETNWVRHKMSFI